MKVRCKKCGKCCIIYNYIKQTWVSCPYLDNKTLLCTIYKKRLGKYLGFGFTCEKRKDLKFNIPDCPYNRKGLKTHPAYK